MASTYPGVLDTMLAPALTLAGPEKHEDIEQRQNDAITAVQTELGTDPAGAFSTVAARLTDIESQLGDLGTPAWQSFTPVFGGITALSSSIGRYTQIGKLVLVIAQGTVSTVGSGQITLTLPVATVSTFVGGESAAGEWHSVMQNPGKYYHAHTELVSTTVVQPARVDDLGASGTWNTGTNLPATWVATDDIMWSGFYEAA